MSIINQGIDWFVPPLGTLSFTIQPITLRVISIDHTRWKFKDTSSILWIWPMILLAEPFVLLTIQWSYWLNPPV